MRRIAALALLAAVCVASSLASAQAPAPQGRRNLVSSDRARRTETLLARAFPGAIFDWDSEQIVYPDGRRVPFSFDFYREAIREGAVFVIASQAPDARQAEAIRQLQAFKAPTADMPHCKLSMMRIDAAGTVLGYKETGVDVSDAASTCNRASFDYAYEAAGLPPLALSGFARPAWPLVLINYSTLHALPDAWATISWAAVLDTGALTWISRLPVFFSGTRRDRRSASFVIQNDRGRGGGSAWVFRGVSERGDQPGWQISVPCVAGGCRVEPRAVLDAALRSPAWR